MTPTDFRRACDAWQRLGHMGLGRVASNLGVSYSELVHQVRAALDDWTDYQTGEVLTPVDFAEPEPEKRTTVTRIRYRACLNNQKANR